MPKLMYLDAFAQTNLCIPFHSSNEDIIVTST